MVDTAQHVLETKVFTKIEAGVGLSRIAPVVGHDSKGVVRQGSRFYTNDWLDPHYWGAGFLVGNGTNPFRLENSRARWAFWMHEPTSAEWKKIAASSRSQPKEPGSPRQVLTEHIPLYVTAMNDAYRIEPAKLMTKLLTMKPSGPGTAFGKITLFAREVKLSSDSCLACHTQSKRGDTAAWMVYAFAKRP